MVEGVSTIYVSSALALKWSLRVPSTLDLLRGLDIWHRSIIIHASVRVWGYVHWSKIQGSRENRFIALLGLHHPHGRVDRIRQAVDMIKHRLGAITGKDKVAMHAADGIVLPDGTLGGRQRLGNDNTAKDAPVAWRPPEGFGVCEDVLSC